jgi:thioester reductase-like protein
MPCFPGARKNVICLLRDGSFDRLTERLTWYFGSGWVRSHSNHIKTVGGDISLQDFGLGRQEYDDLAGKVRRIYHCAADVRHFTNGEDSAKANLRGTEEAVKLALTAGAALMHMSTASVSGDYVKSAPGLKAVFKETDSTLGKTGKTIYMSRQSFWRKRRLQGDLAGP